MLMAILVTLSILGTVVHFCSAPAVLPRPTNFRRAIDENRRIGGGSSSLMAGQHAAPILTASVSALELS